MCESKTIEWNKLAVHNWLFLQADSSKLQFDVLSGNSRVNKYLSEFFPNKVHPIG